MSLKLFKEMTKVSSLFNASMGMAVTMGKLKFEKGDFGAMIKDPRMATPFVKSFALMGAIGGE